MAVSPLHPLNTTKLFTMKKLIKTLCILLSLSAFSQKTKNNEDLILFERTLALQELVDYELIDLQNVDDTILTKEEKIKKEFAKEIKEDILHKIISGYNELIEKFPKSKLIFRALNNKGYAELQANMTDKAKETYLKIMNSQANDQEKGGIGSGIMAEPYANYKNRACKVLAKIEIDTKNYSEALRYLDQTNKYPYRHFCGNEYAADAIYMATMYSNCYLALNDYEKAYDVLLPNILENGLADNSYLIKTAYEALLKKHRKEDLKIEFENAFKNIITEKEISDKYEYTNYYIKFQNRKIQLEPWSLDFISSEDDLKKVATSILTNSEFYKLLTQ